MFRTTIVLAAAIAALVVAPTALGRGQEASMQMINQVRRQTHQCQHELGVALSPVSKMVPKGPLYRRWVFRLWAGRQNDECGKLRRAERDPSYAINLVFGKYAGQAHRVVSCESGHSIYARNGQYENIFQMGHSERQTYGWHTVGSSPLIAARAAWRYFVASGRDWSPWSCKPW